MRRSCSARWAGFPALRWRSSVISVVTGIVTTYGVGLGGGGGAALGLGWPLVSVGTLFVALAMAELASALPTAGALYHWSSVLGGRGWGWGTAAMNLVGQVAIVAAIDLGMAEALVEELSWKPRLVLPVLAVTILVQALINWTSVRLVAVLNDLSAIVQLSGVVVIAALLFFSRKEAAGGVSSRTPASRHGRTGSRHYLAGFVSSLLLGMFTMTGFDASAHAAEETHDAARKAPRGIVTAVVVSGVFGYALVAALALATKDPRSTMADAHPALFVLKSALGDTGGRAAMALALIAMVFCGLSSMTSLSRTIYAFARGRRAARDAPSRASGEQRAREVRFWRRPSARSFSFSLSNCPRWRSAPPPLPTRSSSPSLRWRRQRCTSRT